MKAIFLAITLVLFAQTVAHAQSAAQPDRVIRVTTGYHQVAGWEKPLVDGNPNLGHYHWTPQGGYDQGYLHIRSPQRPQGSVYIKPNHISPDAYVPKNPELSPLANHVDFPSGSRRDTNLAGRLIPERHIPALVAQPLKVATYANYDTRGAIISKTRHVNSDAFSTHETVSGQLLNRGKRSM